MDNKRYYKRINFHITVTVNVENVLHKGELYDISLKGALIKLNKALPDTVGKSCSVMMQLPNSIVILKFESKIVHKKAEYYGFKFEKSDVDSITHLRRLLLLNTGDEEDLDKEILYWLHDS